MRRIYIFALALVVFGYLHVSATIINVPGDYPTIQEGIDASSVQDDDTVLVQPGIYYENVSFHGHSTTLASLFLVTGDTSYISSTIIDGDSSGPVITVGLLAWPPTVVGFTVQNGYAYSGGGIYCEPAAGLTLSHNIVRANSCEYNGGGLFCDGSIWYEINDNLFIENYAGYRGGGVYFIDSHAYMNNNLVYANTTDGDGSGIYLWESGGLIENNVITSNTASGNGGGICCWEGSNPTINYNTISGNSSNDGGGIYCLDSNPPITNTILWADTAPNGPEICLSGTSSPVITYCDVQGGWEGEGNIDCDPMFCDPENGNFYLDAASCCVGAGEGGVDIGALGIGCGQPVPTLSVWGMLIMVLLLLAVGTVAVVRRRKAAISKAA